MEDGRDAMAQADIEIRWSKPGGKDYKITDSGGISAGMRAGGRLWRWDYRLEGKRKRMTRNGVYKPIFFHTCVHGLSLRSKLRRSWP